MTVNSLKAIKAYHYFWAVSIIFGFLTCVSYVSGDNSTLDINVHDTYFVIAHAHLYTVLSVLYLIPGLIYWLSKNLRLVSALTVIHTVVTVGGFIAYLLLWKITSTIYNPDNSMDNSMEIFNTGIMIIFLLVLFAQPLLLINLIIGLAKKIKQ